MTSLDKSNVEFIYFLFFSYITNLVVKQPRLYFYRNLYSYDFMAENEILSLFLSNTCLLHSTPVRNFHVRIEGRNLFYQHTFSPVFFILYFIIVRELVHFKTTAARTMKFWLQVAYGPPIATRCADIRKS